MKHIFKILMKPCLHNHQYMVTHSFFRINGLVLHNIKKIKTLTHQTVHSLLYTLWPMNILKFHKIHKYTNILKMISLNYNPYNWCNHFSKSWGCKILYMYTQSLVPFIVNSDWPYYNFRCNVKQWFASCAYVLQWEYGCLGLGLEVMAWNRLRQLGKNTIKRVTQVNGHFLRLHFCMFKKSQVKHNSLECRNFLWNIFH
jgi:hypothetical protein